MREIRFATTLEEKGFPNADPLTRIVSNGTFINNNEIAPVLGMSRDGLLKDRAKRRKYGLPPELRPPKLEDDERARTQCIAQRQRLGERRDHGDHRRRPDADRAGLHAERYESSTAAARCASRLTRRSSTSSRFSRRAIEIKRDKWQDVELGVYYQPGHDYNVDRMLEAMKASLDVFSEKFSPYQFKQARIMEFPSYAKLRAELSPTPFRTRRTSAS